MLILTFLGLKGVISGGLIHSNDDNLVISEDIALIVDNSGHVHYYYKLQIATFISILLLIVVLGCFYLWLWLSRTISRYVSCMCLLGAKCDYYILV